MPIFYEGRAPMYVGLVLGDREWNCYDDSDFYAVIWDPEKRRPFAAVFNTTRYYSTGRCQIDATDEVRAAYDAWYAEKAQCELGAEMAEETMTPHVGKRVKVVKGRKIPKGTEGVVTWYGEDRWNPDVRYGRGHYVPSRMAAFLDDNSDRYNPMGRRSGFRVRLRLDNGSEVFTSAENVEVLGPAEWFFPQQEAA